jgi:hypothetical protein
LRATSLNADLAAQEDGQSRAHDESKVTLSDPRKMFVRMARVKGDVFRAERRRMLTGFVQEGPCGPPGTQVEEGRCIRLAGIYVLQGETEGQEPRTGKARPVISGKSRCPPSNALVAQKLSLTIDPFR